MSIENFKLPQEAKPLDEVAGRLLKAAQALREHGWSQKMYQERDGRMCAVGAIMFVDGHVPYSTEQASAGAMAAYTRLQRVIGHTVQSWNDKPERTADEVIRALETAAWLSP